MNQEVARQLLLEKMSALSEKHYAAGWISGLEYSLWSIVKMRETGELHINYGQLPMNDLDIVILRVLSEDAGGWWHWKESVGETFVTTEEWKELYRKYEAFYERMDG